MCTEIDLSNNDIKETTMHVKNKAGEFQGKMNMLEKFTIVKKIWLSNNKLRAAEFSNLGFDGKPCFHSLKLLDLSKNPKLSNVSVNLLLPSLQAPQLVIITIYGHMCYN